MEMNCKCATLTVTDYTKKINGKPLVRRYDVESTEEGFSMIAQDLKRTLEAEMKPKGKKKNRKGC